MLNVLTKHFNPAWLTFWLALPLALIVIAAALVIRAEENRYSPDAFTPEAIATHSDYDTFMTTFKQAVFSGDKATVMALQARPNPVDFQFSTAVSYLRPVEAIIDGTVYPYADTVEWHALAPTADFVTHRFGIGSMEIYYDVTVEQVNGRWVLTPRDTHYLLHSGQWRSAAVTAAAAYYGTLTLALGGLWVVRETIARNNERYAAYSGATASK